MGPRRWAALPTDVTAEGSPRGTPGVFSLEQQKEDVGIVWLGLPGRQTVRAFVASHSVCSEEWNAVC